MPCPVLMSTHMLGKKWSVPLIEEIALGEFDGFNRFLGRAKMTPRMLSKQLKELESTGLIRRNAPAADTKHAAYTLSEKGTELHQLVLKIKRWNVRWNKVPEACLETPCTRCGLLNSNEA